MKNRFMSRKFRICLAAFLGSIGTSIAALHTDNQSIATAGIVCAVASAAIYAACEAWVDASRCNDPVIEDDDSDDM